MIKLGVSRCTSPVHTLRVRGRRRGLVNADQDVSTCVCNRFCGREFETTKILGGRGTGRKRAPCIMQPRTHTRRTNTGLTRRVPAQTSNVISVTWLPMQIPTTLMNRNICKVARAHRCTFHKLMLDPSSLVACVRPHPIPLTSPLLPSDAPQLHQSNSVYTAGLSDQQGGHALLQHLYLHIYLYLHSLKQAGEVELRGSHLLLHHLEPCPLQRSLHIFLPAQRAIQTLCACGWPVVSCS